jgi:hypothetical protein
MRKSDPTWDDIGERLAETEKINYSISEAVTRVQRLVDQIDSAVR